MNWALAFLLWAAPAPAQEDGARVSPGLIRPSGLMLFYASEGPLSFVTPGGLPPGALALGEVKGKSCQHGLAIPLAATLRPTSVSGYAGNGGFQKTLESIKKLRPDLDGVYDARVDQHILSILGVYRRVCTEVTARGFKQG